MAKYRTLFVVEATQHDMSLLVPFGQDVKYLTTGREGTADLVEASMVEGLKDFDPTLDAIIPTGKALSNIVLGIYLARKYSGIALSFGAYNRNRQTGEKWYQWLQKIV